jgi:hypothetical protein
MLRCAEETAYKRLRAARAARRFPQIHEAIADGRLQLSGVVLLAPHLTDDNAGEVLAAAAHRSKAEIEVIVARLAPRPDLPTAMTPVAPPVATLPLPQVDPDPVAPRPPAPPPRVTPLAPERFALQVSIDQATRDKLLRALALLRHRNPSGDLAVVLDRALDALLATLEKEKFGVTARPRAGEARCGDADPRYVPREVRRVVHARDGEQCTFTSEAGERCTERGFLELDHRTPVALGGQPTADEIRVLCRVHNQYEAERLLGADLMRVKREQAELAQALRGLGFSAAEARSATTHTAQLPPATTFEARLRAALALLTRSHANRCSEGPLRYGRAPAGSGSSCSADQATRRAGRALAAPVAGGRSTRTPARRPRRWIGSAESRATVACVSTRGSDISAGTARRASR